MTAVVAGRCLRWMAAAVLVTASASARDAGPDATAEGGAGGCSGSEDCQKPAVHCHPARHECVECLSDSNCGGGRVCDEATGKCAPCVADADCTADLPYCAAGACVQCRTDANCGDQGIVCSAGICGSCGDGFCHRSERILEGVNVVTSRACPEDCTSQCPMAELATGEVRTVTATRNLYELDCASVSGLNDVTVAFTSDKEAFYKLRLRGESQDGYVMVSRAPSCGEAQGCWSGPLQSTGYAFHATAGERHVFVVEAERSRTFEVQIVEHVPTCPVPDCGPVPQEDAGPSPEEKTAECLANAAKRGEPACGGVACACGECPGAYDDCATSKDCASVLECMRDKDCIGTDCYLSGACRRLVDSLGGVSGDAFRSATALQSCALSHACSLPCADAGGSAVVDAGALCAPGREVACACAEGATGVKRCDDDGMAYGACDCTRRPAPESSSCDCRLGRGTSADLPTALLFGLAAGLLGRRRGSGHARRRP